MNEYIDYRRWRIVAMMLGILLFLGVFALVTRLDLGLGLAALGGTAILLFGFAVSVPAVRPYFFGEAERRVVARNAPAFCLMLAVVWVVPGLLGYFEVVPETTAFLLAMVAVWLMGVPVLGWHHSRVLEARRELKREAGIAPTTPASPAGAVALEPTTAARPKGLAVSLALYWFSLIPGAIVGGLIVLSVLQISGKL